MNISAKKLIKKVGGAEIINPFAAVQNKNAFLNQIQNDFKDLDESKKIASQKYAETSMALGAPI